MSKPLDLLEKFQLIVATSRGQVRPTSSELQVLIELAQRQNPKTGQCNPSIKKLMEYTGLSDRGVKDARKALCGKGIISYTQRSRLSSCSYTLHRPPFKSRKTKPNEGKQASERQEAGFRSKGNSTSPKKIIEIIPEKMREQCFIETEEQPKPKKKASESQLSPKDNRDRLKLENAVATRLDACGIGRTVLYSLASQVSEPLFQDYVRGRAGFHKTLRLLMEACQEKHKNE